MSRADLARESSLNLLRLELMLVPPWRWEAVNAPVSTNEVMLLQRVQADVNASAEGEIYRIGMDPAMPRPSLWERFKRWWADA